MTKQEKIKINSRTIKKFQNQFNWKGRGIKGDPIIIENVRGLKPKIIFKTWDMYVRIKNINILEIKLIKCQNITIEGCKIYELSLSRCKNININRNIILNVYLDLSGGSSFQNNRFLKSVDLEIKTVGDDKDTRDLIIKIFSSLNVVSVSMIAVCVVLGFFIQLPIYILLLIGSTVVLLDSNKKKKIAKTLQPNVLYNNKVEDLRYIYDEILIDYIDHK